MLPPIQKPIDRQSWEETTAALLDYANRMYPHDFRDRRVIERFIHIGNQNFDQVVGTCTVRNGNGGSNGHATKTTP